MILTGCCRKAIIKKQIV